MTPDKALFEKLDFSFKLEGNAEMISVIPCIELDSDRDHTLIVSFYVDSMEMIESARVAVSKGWNSIPLTQPVRIRRPLLWHPNGGKGIPSLYSFTAVFHHDGKPFYMIEKRGGIRFVSCTGEKVSVNGNEISLSSFGISPFAFGPIFKRRRPFLLTMSMKSQRICDTVLYSFPSV